MMGCVADVAHLVRALGCGPRGSRFNPGHSPHTPYFHALLGTLCPFYASPCFSCAPPLVHSRRVSCSLSRAGGNPGVYMLLVPRVHTLLDPRFHGDDRERDEDERERDGEVTKKKTQMTQRFCMLVLNAIVM